MLNLDSLKIASSWPHIRGIPAPKAAEKELVQVFKFISGFSYQVGSKIGPRWVQRGRLCALLLVEEDEQTDRSCVSHNIHN